MDTHLPYRTFAWPSLGARWRLVHVQFSSVAIAVVVAPRLGADDLEQVLELGEQVRKAVAGVLRERTSWQPREPELGPEWLPVPLLVAVQVLEADEFEVADRIERALRMRGSVPGVLFFAVSDPTQVDEVIEPKPLPPLEMPRAPSLDELASTLRSLPSYGRFVDETEQLIATMREPAEGPAQASDPPARLKRIGRIDIERFRGIQKPTTLDTDADMVVLLGPNGSGKSTLLYAAQWALVGTLWPAPEPSEPHLAIRPPWRPPPDAKDFAALVAIQQDRDPGLPRLPLQHIAAAIGPSFATARRGQRLAAERAEQARAEAQALVAALGSPPPPPVDDPLPKVLEALRQVVPAIPHDDSEGPGALLAKARAQLGLPYAEAPALLKELARRWRDDGPDSQQRRAWSAELASTREELRRIRTEYPDAEQDLRAIQPASGEVDLLGVFDALATSISRWQQGAAALPAIVKAELDWVVPHKARVVRDALASWVEPRRAAVGRERALQARITELEDLLAEGSSDAARAFAEEIDAIAKAWREAIDAEAWDAARPRREAQLAHAQALEEHWRAAEGALSTGEGDTIALEAKKATNRLLQRFAMSRRVQVTKFTLDTSDEWRVDGIELTGGVAFEDHSAGQRSTLRLAIVVAFAELTRSAIGDAFPGNTYLIDNAFDAVDDASLMRELIIWRQLAYAPDPADRRQVFLTMHQGLAPELVRWLQPYSDHDGAMAGYQLGPLTDGKPTITRTTGLRAAGLVDGVGLREHLTRELIRAISPEDP